MLRKLFQKIRAINFRSGDYWENRYRRGGNSGAGSYGRLAMFKAHTLNQFVKENDIQSVIEFGSGDGAQLTHAKYPQYVGIDVSETAIGITRSKFAQDDSKAFYTQLPDGTTADLTMSLDVIYHLIEDEVFERYMTDLFKASRRFVAIYSSNQDKRLTAHVRHRRFTDWISTYWPQAQLLKKVENPFPEDKGDQENTSFADFYFYAL
ncbi:class I SAM-dependent methyltransferase [Sphingomicrobium flavum]|uniref:class I SAM-dependent methyltransferase n=1 Tax=Sphingomicrobium flavum TaxID=1229164 RepID=UPI0021AD67AB|nr:class I SAM-dependent methyltransferase [Sphingomicrobium flavum]